MTADYDYDYDHTVCLECRKRLRGEALRYYLASHRVMGESDEERQHPDEDVRKEAEESFQAWQKACDKNGVPATVETPGPDDLRWLEWAAQHGEIGDSVCWEVSEEYRYLFGKNWPDEWNDALACAPELRARLDAVARGRAQRVTGDGAPEGSPDSSSGSEASGSKDA